MTWGFKGGRSRRALALVLAFGLAAGQGNLSFAQEAPVQPEAAPAFPAPETSVPETPPSAAPDAPASTPAEPSSAAPAAAPSGPTADQPGDAASPASAWGDNAQSSDPEAARSEDSVPAGDAAPGGDAAEARDATLPQDLSPWGMYQAADVVVKAVMIGLAFASLITWTVAVAKLIEIACARARAIRARTRILEAETLEAAAEALARRGGPGAFMVRTAQAEVERSEAVLDRAGAAGLKDRVASYLADIEARAGRRLNTGTGILATIGSTAPFVGLFGTVWGIMNSFIGISKAQTTNLAVVAPGIAEALLATALGLVAAIPAVIIYNVFARQIAGYRHLLREAGTGVERLVSRDLDHRAAGGRGSKPRSLAAE